MFPCRTLFCTGLLAALALSSPAQAAEPYAAKDMELYCVAVPTMDLTPEAAKSYNVERNPNRGLLTVTIVKKAKNGNGGTVPGQIYAGAINQRNSLSNIPIREVWDGNSVYYLGEFQVSTPDTLRFLVNANVLGRSMKSDFSSDFNAQQSTASSQ